MSRRIGIAGILLASFWFAGCSLLMPYTGPCYGIGCHAGLMAPHAAAQQQSAQAKPVNTTKKSRSFTSWLPFKKHSTPAASSAPSTAAPTSSSTSTAPKQGAQTSD
ncbi:MAG TPA: hypothetical protein VMB02_02455 [Candidatus Aquilonibacter sp.]|nr:hypothetical protein [Candidatus Aquilonibacter sp.]